jgi:hypothetical protein
MKNEIGSMTKRGLAALVLAGAAFAAPAMAASITCPDAGDPDRTVTLTYDGSGVTCGPYGSTPPAEGTVMAGLGYNFLEKDDGAGANNNGGLLDISGLNGTGGSFTVDAGVTDAVLLFKFGSGGVSPDWVSFKLNGITSGSWVVSGRQALSHATLYGERGEVPVPGTLGLLGLGLVGLGFARRKQQA